MGRANLTILKHMACHVTKHSPSGWKENMLSLLTSLGKGYCCILLPQIRPDGKILLSQIAFLRTHNRDCKCVDGVTSYLIAPTPFHQFGIYLAKINMK